MQAFESGDATWPSSRSPGRRDSEMPFEIDRSLYARMYGPTTGDRVRLGDTNLLVEVERDEASPGDETLWGFGKANRSIGICCRPGWCPWVQAVPARGR